MCRCYRSESRCIYGNHCLFRHADGEEKPSKRSKKESTQGAVAILNHRKVQGCVSQKSDPKKSIQRRDEQVRGNASAGHTVKFSGRTWYEIRIRETKGPSLGIIQKSDTHERNPCAPRFEERTPEETSRQEDCARIAARNLAKTNFTSSKPMIKLRFTFLWTWWRQDQSPPHERNACEPRFEGRTPEETSRQEDCAREAARDLSKNIFKLRAEDKTTFYSPVETKAAVLVSRNTEDPMFVVDSGASVHMLSKKDSSLDELDTLRRSKKRVGRCRQTRRHKCTCRTLTSSSQFKFSKKRYRFYRLESFAQKTEFM